MEGNSKDRWIEGTTKGRKSKNGRKEGRHRLVKERVKGNKEEAGSDEARNDGWKEETGRGRKKGRKEGRKESIQLGKKEGKLDGREGDKFIQKNKQLRRKAMREK